MENNLFLSVKLAGDILDKRTNEDLSFRELSELTGIDKMNLYRMECGDKSTPRLNDFFLICKWLRHPMEMYFDKPTIFINKKTKINGNSKEKRVASGIKTADSRSGRSTDKGKKNPHQKK